MEECCIVITTTDKENSRKISSALVEERLAACVQMRDIESVYEWDGKVCYDSEVLMLIKTRDELFSRVKDRVAELHSYELPEIVKVRIDDGNEGYLKWIYQMTR